MAEFLVEAYVPSRDEDLDELARAASAAFAAAGTRVLRTIFVPDDETCFVLCEAASAAEARAAAEGAGLRRARVNPAVVTVAAG